MRKLFKIAVFIALFSAFSFYMFNYYVIYSDKQKKNKEAILLFEKLMNHVDSGINYETSFLLTKKLITLYGNTVYAERAALCTIELLNKYGQRQHAIENLFWLIKKEGNMSNIARLRLADLFLEEKNYSMALNQLSSSPAHSAFRALFQDRIGDIFLLKGQYNQAINYYKKALDLLSESNLIRQTIILKINYSLLNSK